MWEYNADQNRFGTPEALMLMPYWTNNCIDSMEGLYFESSATTPYHFLDQAELSVSPSDPMVGLPYGGLDVAFGVQHLQMLGVRYYVAFSPAVIKQANRDPELTLIAKTKKWPSPGDQWFIYKIASSPMVVPLKTLAQRRGQHDEPRRLAQRQHDLVARSQTVGDRRRDDRTGELAHGREHHHDGRLDEAAQGHRHRHDGRPAVDLLSRQSHRRPGTWSRSRTSRAGTRPAPRGRIG